MKKNIDLTHSLSSENSTWDGPCSCDIKTIFDYKDSVSPNIFKIQKLELKAGTGTHIDAPAHCFPDGATIDKLNLENLITNCVVINTSQKCTEDYIVTKEDVEEFERESMA